MKKSRLPTNFKVEQLSDVTLKPKLNTLIFPQKLALQEKLMDFWNSSFTISKWVKSFV